MKKKILIILMLIIMPLCLLLSGCMPKSNDYIEELQNRFIQIKHYTDIDTSFYIVVDKETKIMYLMFINGYKGGITVLLDENGNPQKYEGEL